MNDKPTYLKGIRRAFLNLVEVLIHPCYALLEVGFVVPEQIGRVDLEPAQAALAQLLAFREFEQRTRQIVSDVTEMWGDGVRAATEVEVVRHVDNVAEELRGEGQVSLHSRKGETKTHSAGNLNLVVDATPVGVVACISLCPHLMAREVFRPRDDIALRAF